MNRPLTFTLTAVALFTLPAAAQKFEVASVKPNNSGSGSSHSSSGHGKLTATNNSLRQYIRSAYDLRDYQISGPDWLATERYDISATADDDVPDDAFMPMMQALLAERFKLEVHRTTKELPMYVLVAAKTGPKLQEVEKGGSHTSARRGHLEAQKISMKHLADTLSGQVDRPVIDGTGLEGVYDLKLEWTPDDGRKPNDGDTGPSIFTALQEQLGLKLEARKGPVEILVIDHAEKVPTAN